MIRLALLILLLSCALARAADLPPPLLREFRGAWIASVGNINWPSKRDLTVEQQQAELRALLDNIADLKLNAVLFQIRPAADALYKSDLEPWSEYLTGEMGRAPAPFYDPLEFAVKEAHQRGLELHAWFNPYRAGVLPRKGPVAAKHISKTRPWLVKKYSNYEWMDPGEDAVKEQTVAVILDVVRRYDIDGVHLDDYFYPYKVVEKPGKYVEFPDDSSYNAYKKKGGRLERDDWRRENVNDLMERLNSGIKRIKPHVRFGISPFGIWRPGFPESVRGLDAYEHLYADSRKWLREGWVDYFAPQLYWRIQAPQQSYPELLKWWLAENPKQRYVFPGSTMSGVGKPRDPWPASEIVNQLTLSRELNANDGHILWNYNKVFQNADNLRSTLAQKIYTEPAIGPAYHWLDSAAPVKPVVVVRPESAQTKLTLQWRAADAEKPFLWALQSKRAGKWITEFIPSHFNARSYLPTDIPSQIALTAIDRCGNASAPALLTLPIR